MDEPTERTDSEPELFWPPGQRPSDDEGIRLLCGHCHTRWLVHESMQGFRIRCRCLRWLDVPDRSKRPEPPPRIAPIEPVPAAPARVHGPAPEPAPEPDLRDAGLLERRRWINRSLIELFLMLSAIMTPYIVLFASFEGSRRALFMPVAALASGLLVMLTALLAGQHTYAAIRRCSSHYFVEGPLVTVLWVLAAFGLSSLVQGVGGGADDPLSSLRTELGVGWALFVIAICPAIFEEIAFRGLLQARLIMLFGRGQGLLITAAAFGLAHGVTIGLPLQMFLGLYLGWLRDRSGSLVPGMLVHFLYNGSIVLLT